MRGLLRWHVESGTDGIVALGTTGEASVLSHAERQRVLEITVEEAGQVLPIVAGTSSVNPQVVIEQSNQVCESGRSGYARMWEIALDVDNAVSIFQELGVMHFYLVFMFYLP